MGLSQIVDENEIRNIVLEVINENLNGYNNDEINRLFNIITTVRNIRSEKNVGLSKKINIVLFLIFLLLLKTSQK